MNQMKHSPISLLNNSLLLLNYVSFTLCQFKISPNHHNTSSHLSWKGWELSITKDKASGVSF